MRCFRFVLVLLLAATFYPVRLVLAQSAPPAQDGAAVWQALSAPTLDPAKSAQVQNVQITRDRVHLTLSSGTIQFFQPANGVVFAGVFHGEGRLQADPPNSIEAQQLRLFTKQEKLDMSFTEATFSFSDGLFDEVAKQVQWSPGSSVDDLYAKRQQDRENLGGAYLPRLYKSVLSGDRARTAYFLADLKTKEKGWVEVRDDAMQLEEIRVGRWGDLPAVKVLDVWMEFAKGERDFRHVYDDPFARQDFLIPSYQINASVADNADLNATARVSLLPRYSGERVLLFGLDSNLRVSSVKDSEGRSLEFFQPRETKDRYQSYGDYVAIVLKNATDASRKEDIEFQYGGKRAIRRAGDGNYFCERIGWYPAVLSSELGVEEFAARSDFELNFRSPKKYGLVATGHKVSETTEGNLLLTTWKSEIPLAVAGFAYGAYKTYTEKVGDVEVQVFANRQPDDLLRSIQHDYTNATVDMRGGSTSAPDQAAPIGELNAAALVTTMGKETANTLRIFQNYFGPYPYKELVVTNIRAEFGQGWPGLLYLSWLTFLDSTQRNALGITDQTGISDSFRAHESSHQWWGHRVGWKSYHDQWLSEGFAEFSGALYVQYRQNMKEYLDRWWRMKQLLKRGDIKSHTVESLGPIWMGRRIISSETDGRAYQDLIYSKGAYVLQMLRMMLYDNRNPDPDRAFKAMMQDYCKTFDNKPASTEDFKAIVEKHMLPVMDADGNHKMDWFFNQYVYGTGIPQYSFHSTVEPTADGKTHIKMTISRTGVPDDWKDVVPIYAHVGDKTIRLGALSVKKASDTTEATVPGKIDKITINDFDDLLADVK